MRFGCHAQYHMSNTYTSSFFESRKRHHPTPVRLVSRRCETTLSGCTDPSSTSIMSGATAYTKCGSKYVMGVLSVADIGRCSNKKGEIPLGMTFRFGVGGEP